VGWRTDVAGVFPDDASLLPLTAMLAIEQHDEWLVGHREDEAEGVKAA
jgi:hypothetical protein